MKCPTCGNLDTRVIRCAPSRTKCQVRRRHVCERDRGGCGGRWTSIARVAKPKSAPGPIARHRAS